MRITRKQEQIIIKTSEKPSISKNAAMFGTTNVLMAKNRLHVFSNSKSLVNFSGKAYKPNNKPASIANKTPVIINILFKF